MKALAITLCLLLTVPAGAQQMAGPASPNFYVPYAVTPAPTAAAVESSSDDARFADSARLPGALQPQHYPARPGYRPFAPRLRGYPPPAPAMSPRAAAILLGVVTGIILIGVAKANQ